MVPAFLYALYNAWQLVTAAAVIAAPLTRSGTPQTPAAAFGELQKHFAFVTAPALQPVSAVQAAPITVPV